MAGSSGGPVGGRFDAWVRKWTYYQAGRRPRAEATTLFEHPEPDEGVERAARRAGYALAVAAPLLVCVAMVAVRDDIDRSTAALVLVLPVVVVALIGGPAPATIAAAVASLSFDVLLTRPYYRVEIHAAEDVEATVILLVVGTVVGQLVARETRSRLRSTARGTQLDALVGMVATAAREADDAALVDRVAVVLTNLLDLRHCHWSPDFHGTAHPVLGRDGEIEGRTASPEDRAPLPDSGVELPVLARDRELGRLILVPARSTPISREERLVAIAIADVFGLALATNR